ncbi:MAG: hypothetical protein ACREA9_13045, partial [Pyrinomonadaceae bacterium]
AWEELKEKVGDLKENLLGKISKYLIPTVIIAGITWIVSLLNPASAFIKACKAIIDIVMFIVERGAQIMAFVNAVLDAVIAIAAGAVGGVSGLIETALATAIPVLIGFLAALLGIGGLADKVKKFFQSLSKPVMQAVDWIVDKIAAFGKQIWAKLKGAGKKLKDKIRGGDDSPEGKQKRFNQAMLAAVAAANRLGNRPVGRAALTPVLAGIRIRYGLTSLKAVEDGPKWAVEGALNPERKDETNLPRAVEAKDRRYPNQKCTNERLDELHKQLHPLCDQGFSCSDETERSVFGITTRKKLGKLVESGGGFTQSEIHRRLAMAEACLAMRKKIQDECFTPDPTDPLYISHMEQVAGVQNAIDGCRAKLIARRMSLPQ